MVRQVLLLVWRALTSLRFFNMSVDPRNFLLHSNYPTDKIVEIISSDDVGTVTVASGATSTQTYVHSLGDTAFFVGKFWLDGTTKQAPLGSTIVVSGDYSDINAIFTDGVYATSTYITSTDFHISFVNNDASSQTVAFEIYLISKSDQLPLETGNLSKLSFSSNYNYFKIAQDSTVAIPSLAAASSSPFYRVQTITIPHNLGYVPMVRAFVETDIRLATGTTVDSGGLRIRVNYSIDDTNLYLQVSNFSTTDASATGLFHYRIYYDD